MKRTLNTRYNLRKKPPCGSYTEPDGISEEEEEKVFDKANTLEEKDDEDCEQSEDEEDDCEQSEDEEGRFPQIVREGVRWVDKLKAEEPESYKKWVDVNEELSKTEPNIRKVLREEMSVKDMARIVQFLEVYQASAMDPDEGTISLRSKINRMIENAKREYSQLSEFSDEVKEQISLMDRELAPVNTHNIYKYKILTLKTPRHNKEAIYKRFLEMVEAEDDGDEYFKIKRWLDCALSLPHDEIRLMPETSNFGKMIVRARRLLDRELYGMDNVKEQILLYLNNRFHNPTSRMSLGLIGCPGVGKCFAKNTPIMMFSGKIKLVQNIQVGDLLMGDDSSERRVLSLARGIEKMYKIVQSNGIDYTVNASHILSLFSTEQNKVVDLSVTKYFFLSDEKKETLLGVKTGVSFGSVSRANYDLEPYLVGYFTGRGLDGSIRMTHACNSNVWQRIHEMVELEKVEKEEDIYKIKKWKFDQGYRSMERIPFEYLQGPVEDRKYILLGLMDACVSMIDDVFKIATYNKGFHDDCVFLARSLGLKVTTKLFPNVRVKNRIVCFDLRVISICTKGFEKFFDDDPSVSNSVLLNTYPIQVYEEADGEYYGFTLSGKNSRFLLGDFTIAHNTKIARSLAKILDYPFEQISFGGITGPEFIRGHDYTYIGSKPGMIVEALKRMKCKNGILFLDEIDKVSENKDISSTLLHVTDPIQNHEFRDRYMSELTIDLSQLWFIYSMNSYPADHALRDRMHIIEVQGYSSKEKITICRDFLFPSVLESIGRNRQDIIASDDVLYHLINRACSPSDKGVRTIEKAVLNICSKINFLISNATRLGKLGSISFNKSTFILSEYPIELSKDMIDTFTAYNESDYILRTMYM